MLEGFPADMTENDVSEKDVLRMTVPALPRSFL